MARPLFPWLLVSFLLLMGCKPEITGNTYYCGLDGICPPELGCDRGNLESFAFDCVLSESAIPFACPEITLDVEPDESPEDAFELGSIACGAQINSPNWGCLTENDVDQFTVTIEEACAGSNPRLKTKLRFPLGAGALRVELLDEDGTVLGASELCTPNQDTTGTDLQCLETTDLPAGSYRLRVSIDESANMDCEGSCRFNRYQLFVSLPVS